MNEKNFYRIQGTGGSSKIFNLNQVTTIEWAPGYQAANVKMADGQSITLRDRDANKLAGYLADFWVSADPN